MRALNVLEQKIPAISAKISFSDPAYTDLLDRIAATDRLYVGLPLSAASATFRGSMLEAVARRFEDTFSTTRDPLRERTYNGKAWACAASFDFIRCDGSKVEVKSARLNYHVKKRQWLLKFCNVRREKFDHCVLVCYTPCGIYIGEWDGTRYSSAGKISAVLGGHITVVAPSQLDWLQSLEIILREKFPGRIVAYMPWPRYAESAV